jgi:hypothetical protein
MKTRNLLLLPKAIYGTEDPLKLRLNGAPGLNQALGTPKLTNYFFALGSGRNLYPTPRTVSRCAG